MKKFVAGLILGAGLMFGVGAHAEVVNYVGRVIEGQFNVSLNGKKIDQPGIVIDGVSYLPTRTVAEMFGADVKFDADFGVEITKNDEIPISKVPTIHPTSVRMQEISKEIAEVGTAKLRLEEEIHRIKTTHATMHQDTSELEKQVAEYERQLNELYAEKSELEAQLTGNESSGQK